jgi:TetR/AcrR family transcriptional regulator, mexCD-oprJ operon repressor
MPAQRGAGSGLAGARRASYHQDIADRNAEAILDAAEELLRADGHASISAVAALAGVSRVTVYAHFPTWQALLEAAVQRAVGRVMAALESAHLNQGPPTQALGRMLAAAWQHLAHYQAMAQAVSELLSPEAVARTHQAAHESIGALLERGMADGSFRTDLPAAWLATACIALIHACADSVRAGTIGRGDAERILRTSVHDLFTSGVSRRPGPTP